MSVNISETLNNIGQSVRDIARWIVGGFIISTVICGFILMFLPSASSGIATRLNPSEIWTNLWPLFWFMGTITAPLGEAIARARGRLPPRVQRSDK